MIGETFNDFKILELIGSGAMGKVYLALQQSLQREVAIKVITADSLAVRNSAETIERFLREATLAASIQHPNVVGIYSAGKEKNFFYIVMEYIRGSSLDAQIARHPLPEPFAWNIALQAGQGLQAALQNGIIHRDIKPANILMTPQNMVKISDFGLAKKMDDQSHLTQAGMIFGTPNYMSPEQASGEKVDFRSDIYSLGATIYHALTGHTLFSAPTVLAVMLKHQSSPADPPQHYVSSLKKETALILGKMVHKNRDFRYQSYGELLADIQALLNEKPLNFFNHADSLSVYTHNPFEKDYSGSRKILKSLMSILPASSKGKSIPLLFVSNLQSSDLNSWLEKSTSPKINLSQVTSLPELIVCLGQSPGAVILLDANYLGPQIFQYCGYLRKNNPDAPLLILSENCPDTAKSSEGIVPFRYTKNPEEMARVISSFCARPDFQAGKSGLKMLLELAQKSKWSVTLSVNQGTEEEGSLVLSNGEIVTARQKQLRGEMAIHSLAQNDKTWTLETTRLSSHQETTLFPSPGKSEDKISTISYHASPRLEQTITEFSFVDGYESRKVSGKPPKILVVEKEMGAGEELVNALSHQMGAMAFCVDTPEDALSLMNMEEFDAVVSRQSILRYDGLSLYKEIARAFPHLFQVVVVDADGSIPEMKSNTPGISFIAPQNHISTVLQIFLHR